MNLSSLLIWKLKKHNLFSKKCVNKKFGLLSHGCWCAFASYFLPWTNFPEKKNNKMMLEKFSMIPGATGKPTGILTIFATSFILSTSKGIKLDHYLCNCSCCQGKPTKKIWIQYIAYISSFMYFLCICNNNIVPWLQWIKDRKKYDFLFVYWQNPLNLHQDCFQ